MKAKRKPRVIWVWEHKSGEFVFIIWSSKKLCLGWAKTEKCSGKPVKFVEELAKKG